MAEDSAELWIPSPGDAIPECLLGEPLLVSPEGDGFFALLTSSLWTPLTWGDSVRGRRHPDGGFTITGLAAAGPFVRTVVTYSPDVPAMVARTVVHSWREVGAEAIEAAAGLFIIAWDAGQDEDAIVSRVTGAGKAWSVVELWTSEERTPKALRDYLQPR